MAGLCSLESLRDPERQNRTPAVLDSAGHQARGEERMHKAEVSLSAPGHMGHTFSFTAHSKSQAGCPSHRKESTTPLLPGRERSMAPPHAQASIMEWEAVDWESIPESPERMTQSKPDEKENRVAGIQGGGNRMCTGWQCPHCWFI